VGRTEVAEWEEPRHPGPFRLSRGDCTPLSPTTQHNSFQICHLAAPKHHIALCRGAHTHR